MEPMDCTNYQVIEHDHYGDKLVALVDNFTTALAVAELNVSPLTRRTFTVQPIPSRAWDVQITDTVTVFWSESDSCVMRRATNGYNWRSAL